MGTNGAAPSTTVSVDLPDQSLLELDELAKRKNNPRSQALAEAIATTKYLSDQQESGGKVVVKQPA